jgi:hypothetical protein
VSSKPSLGRLKPDIVVSFDYPFENIPPLGEVAGVGEIKPKLKIDSSSDFGKQGCTHHAA